MHVLPGSLVNSFSNQAGEGVRVELVQDGKKTGRTKDRDIRDGRAEREKEWEEGRKEGRKERRQGKQVNFLSL